MRYQQTKFKNDSDKYSVLIGNNILNILPKEINKLCPATKKIAIIIDKKVPRKFSSILKKILKKYDLYFFVFKANEKNKNFKTAYNFLTKILSKNLKRSDLIISVGGGITGDVIGFVSSIYKRGVNFINLPTTLLAQVDASIGGKSGVNSKFGKNLVGSFHQPKLVISDISFLNSLSRKEMICGYAEILKHSIIKDRKFFLWLKKNTKDIFEKKSKKLVYAIKKSCEIKMYFVNKDVNEKNLRMILNFGHTFAHAIEIKNNYSQKISHGEAVLSGMILEAKLSKLLKLCEQKDLNEIIEIYKSNNLSYTFKSHNRRNVMSLIPYLEQDKKNNDDKINFVLLKKIGKTTLPNKTKISISNLEKYANLIT